MADQISSNEFIERQLDDRLQALEQVLGADVLAYIGPIYYGVDGAIRDAIEERISKRDRTAVVLQTEGGYIEVAQRIADTIRKHYGEVEFIIPNNAMSAGTVLVMSGDAIYMDYFSVLGPIDPQVERPGGGMIPALGYLIQYERLLKKSRQGRLSTAEMAILIHKFDPAEMYRYEQARELSITLLKQWLAKYKFKNWRRTASRKLRVTERMKIKRASEIAAALNDTERWHSHARGISMEVLRKELNLQIEDFGANLKLSETIKNYYKLLTDYMMRRGQDEVVHTIGRYKPLAEG